MPILERMTLRDARVEASRRGQAEGWPRCYYWSAIWWRLYARESAVPHEQLRYSRNQMAFIGTSNYAPNITPTHGARTA